jgi:hypothetical protein
MSNRVRVQQHPHGLYSVSIPRALVQALQIQKGEGMEWVLIDGDLVLRRLESPGDDRAMSHKPFYPLAPSPAP